MRRTKLTTFLLLFFTKITQNKLRFFMNYFIMIKEYYNFLSFNKNILATRHEDFCYKLQGWIFPSS